MTSHCQACGQSLGPEPQYDRPVGWLRLYCADCAVEMGMLSSHEHYGEEEDEDYDDA